MSVKKTRYWVARCQLCKSQWAIKGTKALGEVKGCDFCGAGKGSIKLVPEEG